MIDLTALSIPPAPGTPAARPGGSTAPKGEGFERLLAMGPGTILIAPDALKRQDPALAGKNLPVEGGDAELAALIDVLPIGAPIIGEAQVGLDPASAEVAEVPDAEPVGDVGLDAALVASTFPLPVIPLAAPVPAGSDGSEVPQLTLAPVAGLSPTAPVPSAPDAPQAPPASDLALPLMAKPVAPFEAPIVSAGRMPPSLPELPAVAPSGVPTAPNAATAVQAATSPVTGQQVRVAATGPSAPLPPAAPAPGSERLTASAPVVPGTLGMDRAPVATRAEPAPAAASIATQPTLAARHDPVAGPAAQVFARQLAAPATLVPPMEPTEEIGSIDAAQPIEAPLGAGTAAAALSPRPVAAASRIELPVLDTRQGDWMAEMIDQIDLLRSDAGGRSMRIRLSPDALGAIEIRFDQPVDGDVGVRIHAENPAARALISEAAPRLTEMAEARGLKLSHQQGEAAGQPGRDAQPQSQARTPASASRAPAATSDDPSTNDLSADGRIA